MKSSFSGQQFYSKSVSRKIRAAAQQTVWGFSLPRRKGVTRADFTPQMKIHLANFGLKNYLWPTCREQSTIAMTEDRDLRVFWERGDRAGSIAFALANKKSTSGRPLTKGTASRWYSLPNIFAESVGDIWLHREKDELWWSISKSDPATTTIEPSQVPGREGTNVFVMHKPVESWSNKNRKGARLLWSAIHPMARNFLWNRGTTVQLTPDNVAYAQALIDGDDLAPWHSRKDWEKTVEDSGKGLATVQDIVARAAMQMAVHRNGDGKEFEWTRSDKRDKKQGSAFR